MLFRSLVWRLVIGVSSVSACTGGSSAGTSNSATSNPPAEQATPSATTQAPTTTAQSTESATAQAPMAAPGSRTVVLTNVRVSETDAATFEQIHLLPGDITLETTSESDLLACPGGWHGTAIRTGQGSWAARWMGEDCKRFNRATPARLPAVQTTIQHYAIAVLSTAGTINVPELRLTYQAGDDAEACYVAEVEQPCE